MSDQTTSESVERAERAQPESLRLRSLSPLITVNDLAASMRWYSEVMGFTQTGDWKDDDGNLRGAQMTAGTVDFILQQDDFEKGRDRPKGVGFRFYCRTVQDVDALAAAIRERGGTLDMEPTEMPWGKIFAVTDPDGFKISIGNEAQAEGE